MPRRKKGFHDTEVWKRELEQVGLEYGKKVRIEIPVFNPEQMRRAAGILESTAKRMFILNGMNWPDRKRVFEMVRAVRSGHLAIRSQANYGRKR